jgi:hypothetical protein
MVPPPIASNASVAPVADPDQHLAQIRCGGGVDQRLVPFAAHRIDKAERGQRIDESRRALLGAGTVGQDQARARIDHPILRVHRAGYRRDHFAQQRLRLGLVARRDHRAGAFVADRHRRAEPRLHRAHRGRRHRSDDPPGRIVGIGEIGRAEQQAKIGRIDRRCLDSDQHLVAGRRGHLFVPQFDDKSAFCAIRARFKRRYDVPVHDHGRSLRDRLL